MPSSSLLMEQQGLWLLVVEVVGWDKLHEVDGEAWNSGGGVIGDWDTHRGLAGSITHVAKGGMLVITREQLCLDPSRALRASSRAP